MGSALFVWKLRVTGYLLRLKALNSANGQYIFVGKLRVTAIFFNVSAPTPQTGNTLSARESIV
jgi:hypothetical protein